ncbi:hypothetical protein V8D89_012293 [Ganoderma adspersum]
MRLLDTETGRFIDHQGGVPYAILSHVWDKRELSYQDLQQIQSLFGRNVSLSDDVLTPQSSILTPTPLGCILDHPDVTPKVRDACRISREHGYRYIWIDSCCIDKTSSSELSEAINSMHRWYRDASVCYAFLVDVPTAPRSDIRSPGSAFHRSRWFTRGWTLQELIAPRSLVFLSQNWVPLGTKESLVDVVETITGIDQDILRHHKPLDQVSVARRMSWASRRNTTRVEDEAYCLLGIFGINMETLYGEGRHAFFRLQERILMLIPDQSIFAWGLPFPRRLPPPAPPDVLDFVRLDATLFAQAPADFAQSDAIVSLPHHVFRAKLHRSALRPPEYSFSSYGMKTQLPVVPAHAHYTTPEYVFVILACQHSAGADSDDFVAIVFSVYADASAPVSESEAHTQLVSGGLRWRPQNSTGSFRTCRLVALSPEDIRARQSPRIRDLLWSVYLPSYDRSNSESALVTVEEVDVLLAPSITSDLAGKGYEVGYELASGAGSPIRRFELSLRRQDIGFFIRGTFECSRHGDHVVACLVVKECPMRDLYGEVVREGSMLWIHSCGRTEVTWTTISCRVSLAFCLDFQTNSVCHLVVEEISVSNWKEQQGSGGGGRRWRRVRSELQGQKTR